MSVQDYVCLHVGVERVVEGVPSKVINTSWAGTLRRERHSCPVSPGQAWDAGSQFLDQRKNPRLPVEARSLNHWTAREDPRGLRLSVLPGPRSLPRGPALQQTLPELMATESGGGILGQRTEGYQGHGRGALHSLIELSLHLVSSSAK